MSGFRFWPPKKSPEVCGPGNATTQVVNESTGTTLRAWPAPQTTRLMTFLNAVTNLQKLAFVLFLRNSLVLQPGANSDAR